MNTMTKEPGMRNEYRPRFSKWFFLAGAMSVIIGSGVFLWASENKTRAKERKIMEVTEKQAMPNRVIPPIDVAAPLKTETATFALG
jgi:hypothetical protein